MPIAPFDADVMVHSKLGDDPNADNNLTSSELKALYDTPAQTIKEYINNTLIPSIDALDPETALQVFVSAEKPGFHPALWFATQPDGSHKCVYINRNGDEVNVNLNKIQDGSITGEKIADKTVTREKLADDVLNSIYPVGCVYTSSRPTPPDILFGGTWEQIKDKFLLAAGTDHPIGETGGVENVTLTLEQIPSHAHQYGYYNYAYKDDESSANKFNAVQAIESYEYPLGNTMPVGGGEAHNNMPPFKAYYMWERIA